MHPRGCEAHGFAQQSSWALSTRAGPVCSPNSKYYVGSHLLGLRCARSRCGAELTTWVPQVPATTAIDEQRASLILRGEAARGEELPHKVRGRLLAQRRPAATVLGTRLRRPLDAHARARARAARATWPALPRMASPRRSNRVPAPPAPKPARARAACERLPPKRRHAACGPRTQPNCTRRAGEIATHGIAATHRERRNPRDRHNPWNRHTS